VATAQADVGSDPVSAMRQFGIHLKTTRTAFWAQHRRRNELIERITSRLKPESEMEHEKFFFRYYDRLDREERFEFDLIRAITEDPSS
jgi:hypothetical protein